MKRNYKFIKALIQLRLQHLMVFRLGFFGPFFVDGSLFIIQLLVFEAIFSQVESIGSWGKADMIIFVGTFSLINALNMVIYFFGVLTIPDKIRNGDLDFYITKPINPLLRITFENVNPGSIPLIFLSLAIITYGIKVGDFILSVNNGLLYILFIFLMTLLFFDLEVIIRTISFFVISTTNITRLEGAGIDLCIKIPGVFFKGIYKLLFYCFLPYALIATYPTLCLTGRIKISEIIFGVIITIVFTTFTMSFWKIGCKHYKSASS